MKEEIKEDAGTVRFTVTVERDAYEVLERYCELLSLTKSNVVNSWLISASDAMGSLIDCMEKAMNGEMSLLDLERKLKGFEDVLKTVENMRE